MVVLIDKTIWTPCHTPSYIQPPSGFWTAPAWARAVVAEFGFGLTDMYLFQLLLAALRVDPTPATPTLVFIHPTPTIVYIPLLLLVWKYTTSIDL